MRIRAVFEYCRYISQFSTMIPLCFDKFGNYFIQSVMKIADEVSYKCFVATLVEDAHVFAQLATHTYGSHVIQLAIYLARDRKSSSIRLVECLCKNLLYLSSNYLGSICLQMAIKELPSSSRLLAALAPMSSQMSMDRHGKAIVISALKHACSQTLGVMEKDLANNLERLVASNPGFEVITTALEIEKQGNINPKYSRVRLFTQNIKYTFHFLRLINYLVIHFPSHEVVREHILPSIIHIVSQRATHISDVVDE